MTDFKVGDRVIATRDGRGWPVVAGDLGLVTAVDSDPITVHIQMDDSRGYREETREGLYIGAPNHMSEIFRVVTPDSKTGAAVDEKMIPASRVREVARRYAERHGWCNVVDAALEEMGATDDELVDVTITQTRTVRLRKSDLGKMKTREQMMDFATTEQRINWSFKLGDTPSSATLQSFDWQIDEPVAVSGKTDDDEWIENAYASLTRPREGTRVRVRPGTIAYSLHGMEVPGGSEGVVVNSDGAASGRVAVRLDMGGTRQLIATALQIRRG